jgi:Uma2 family endonuclease
MATLPNARTVTYEEWLAMPQVEDAVEEVVNGEIRIMPPPKWNHAQIVEALRDLIGKQVDTKLIRVVVNPFGLIIRQKPLTSRVPDLAVFERSTIIERDGYVHSAPQLAVKVLSHANSRREQEEKLADYAEIGVPEVWVIAPQGRTIEVLLLANGRLVREHFLGTGDVLKPRMFPHVQVDIAQIWPD